MRVTPGFNRTSTLDQAFNLVDDLLILREPARLHLRKNKLAVKAHLEAATIGGDECDRAELLPEGVHDRFCQAHGLWHIVSSHTVLQFDFRGHRHLLF